MSDADLPAPGDLFASRYRIAHLLGRGGFGAVFHALDTSLDREVALKVLLRTGDEQSLARFLREARASAALASEHVATVYEVGSTGDGPFIVMELLRGCDLQDELDDRSKLAVTEAVDHVLQAALGIAHAHARGIVHRDLKPRNLFVARRDDGTSLIKVLDFGIAKQTTTDLTQTGTTLGTPRYMAPEQLRSARTVDARTDVWALGVVLYELVSGKPIFDGETATELAVSIVVDPHVKLRARDATLPAELEALVDRCLEKDPDDRFPDVHQLALALAPFATAAGKALVPRIERALGERSSAGAIKRSAAIDETIQATPAGATDQTVQAPTAKPTVEAAATEQMTPPAAPRSKQRRGSSDADGAASSTKDNGGSDRQAPASPGRNDRDPSDGGAAPGDRGSPNRGSSRGNDDNDDADRAATTRADLDGPAHRGDIASRDQAAARSKVGRPSGREHDAEGREGREGRDIATREVAGASPRSSRTTVVALFVAVVALAIAVAMWLRPRPDAKPELSRLADGSGTPSGSSAPSGSDSPSGSKSATVSPPAGSGSAGSGSASGSGSAGSATRATLTGSGARTGAGRTEVARPRRVAPAEVEGIARTCVLESRIAPRFLIPNNDGPRDVQCDRLAGLGCAGIANGCKTRPVSDEERGRCRDFTDRLQQAGVCQ